ncbi:unnamed protein product [Rhizophagus irregularis]|nr:unnamed protein product [Rhizophagus irregularis]
MTPKIFKTGLVDKRGKVRPHSWFLDLQKRVTIPDSNDRLSDHYSKGLPKSTFSSAVELQPCNPSSNTFKRWIVTLDDYGLSVFGKQLAIQLACGTSNIVHWVDPSCVDFPGNMGQISNPHSLVLETHNEKILHSTTTVTSPFTWADIEDQVRLHYSKWDMITPDFSPIDATPTVLPVALTAAASAELSCILQGY